MRTLIASTFLALFTFCFVSQPAIAQPPGRGGFGGGPSDEMRKRMEEMRARYANASDKEREELRRQFMEMRSRGGFGGSSSRGGYDGRRDDDRGRDSDRDRYDRSRYGSYDRGSYDRGSYDRSRYDRGRSDDKDRNAKPAVTPYVPKPHDPLAVAIPEQFAAADFDGDTQIDLLEWRQWKPQEVGKFLQMDSNNDGFLTARELVIAEAFPEEFLTGTPGSVVPTTLSPTPVPAVTPTPTNDNNGNRAPAADKPSAKEAAYVFRFLDRNRNKKLEESEWMRSRGVRNGFASQGIQLEFPVDEATFLSRYPAQRLMPTHPLR